MFISGLNTGSEHQISILDLLLLPSSTAGDKFGYDQYTRRTHS